MSMTDAERHVAENSIKANRRLRVFYFVMSLLVFSGVIALLVEQRNSDNRFKEAMAAAIQEIKIQNEETRQFDTCLLLVPIQDRSREVQKRCFAEADQPGGLDGQDFQTSPPEESSQIVVPSNNTATISRPDSTREQPEPVIAPPPETPNSQTTPPEEPKSVLPFVESCTVNLLGVCI